MNNNDTDKKIAVMQAYTRGKKIECRNLLARGAEWMETTLPAWDWKTWDYRVKPETRTVYRLVYSDGSTWESADRQAAISRWCDALRRTVFIRHSKVSKSKNMNELNHGPGKGDKDRSPGWRNNYDSIDWQRDSTKPDGFRQYSIGKRKKYTRKAD